MAKIKNKVKSAVVQARENTAAYYAKNAGKSTAWDKVKDYVNTGRQYQAQAIEELPTYYADRINSRKKNSFLVREEDAPEPDTLAGMSYSGDPKLNAYLQEIKAKADKAVYDPRPAEKPAVFDVVNDFVNTGKHYRTQAIEDTAAYYKDAAMNSPRVELGSMSPSGDPEFDAYLQKINADPYKATADSRTIEKPVIIDEVKDFINTGRRYQTQGIEDRAQYYKENIGYSNDGTDKWLKAGAFEDGWQLGDGVKSYIASLADGWRQTKAGVYGLGEKAADTVLMVSPLLYGGLEPTEERRIYPVYSFDPEKRKREKQLYGEWVAEDLYDEEAMAENIYTARIMEKLGIDVERDSLLGEKAKDFSYRAGQEAAIYALKEAKIPQWFTRGIVTFAEEAENALRSGADYDEALKSALIHAGAEAAATALSTSWKRLKNVKINDKTIEKYFDAFIDEKRFKNVSEDMSRYSLRAMIKSGFDIMTEGIETLFVWGTGKYAESITYQSDKTFRQLIESEEAKTKLWEAFWQGYIFGYLETSEDD